MARGGYRPGAGRPKKAAPPKSAKSSSGVRLKGGHVEPLDYMLAVISDPDADEARRDRMAIAAAPYRHPKIEAAQEGKKAQRQAIAEQAVSGGKFAVPDGPKLVVNNRR